MSCWWPLRGRSHRAPSARLWLPALSSRTHWSPRPRWSCSRVRLAGGRPGDLTAAPRGRRRAAAPGDRQCLAVGAASAGDESPGRRIRHVPRGVDGDDRRDDEAIRQLDRRTADPPFIARSPRSSLPTVAPAPAPTLPSVTGSAVPLRRSVSAIGPWTNRYRCRPASRTEWPPARSARPPALVARNHVFLVEVFHDPSPMARPNALRRQARWREPFQPGWWD